MDDHLDAALSSPFFLSLPTPLPRSIQDDLTYVSSADPSAILSFWGDQLGRMERLASDSLSTDRAWNDLIPTTIRPAAGKLRLPPLLSLLNQRNMGGAICLQQFLFGFKRTGALRQRFAFSTSEKALPKRLIRLSKIASSTSSRFAERASRSGFKNAHLLRSKLRGKPLRAGSRMPSICPLTGPPSPYTTPSSAWPFSSGFNKLTNYELATTSATP